MLKLYKNFFLFKIIFFFFWMFFPQKYQFFKKIMLNILSDFPEILKLFELLKIHQKLKNLINFK
jgi:hypothetical protein